MRYLTLLLFVFSFFSLNGQNCPPGSVTITSQEEMDDFAATYPNCTQINGSFTTETNDIYGTFYPTINIPSLPALQHITGNISIQTYTNLSDSFTALTQVDGGIYISAYVGGEFPVLESIGGSISLSADDMNTGTGSTGSYPALRYIGGNLHAGGSEGGFMNSADFPLLERIEGNISGCGWTPTHDFSAFDNLRYIGGDITTQQGTITGMNMVDTIGGDIVFMDCFGINSIIINITGLNELEHIGGAFFFDENHCVQDLSGLCNYFSDHPFPAIDDWYGCSINETDIMQSCGSVAECPPGDVIITSQQEMDDFVANFPNCTTINGDLRIRSDVAGADALTDISGLSMLTHISGDLRITEAFYLPSLDGLEQLEWIGGDLRFDFIWDRATPLNISALDHAITIDGIVYLGDIVAPFTQIEPCGVQAICDHYFLSPNNIVNVYGACGSFFQACQDPSADCPQGDVIISSQADMDYFAATYPNCTQINGDWIMDTPPYTYTWINIAELPALERITGNISIQTRTMLSANSFSALTQVDGGVHLSTEIEGDFPALESIGGSIIVFDGSNTGAGPTGGYPALKYIGGGISAGGPEGGFLNSNDFPLLERIEGGIYGCGWGSTHNFSGFDNLRYIGGSITTQDGTISGMNMVDTIGGSINFQTCYLAYIPIQITGLNQLKYIGGNLRFNTQHCLQDLSGLTQLETIGGDLGITLQTGFACSTSTDSLAGLGQLRHVGDDLVLFESNLTNIDFLGQLESVGDSLFIRSNSFDNLDALNHTVDIGGELIISQNWNLSECAVQAVCDHLNSNAPTTIGDNLSGCDSPLEVQAACDPMLLCPSGDITLTTQAEIDALFTTYANCTELPGRLTISPNSPDDINNLDALSQLTSIGNSLVVDNTSISNLNGLQNLTTTGYSLVISNNANLTSLVGLENITSTASHLKIENNEALTDLSGLNNIAQIGESLLIFDNANLQNLSGLNALTSIGSQLYLKSNINMTSFSGLESLTSIGTDIRLQNNTNLASISALSNVNSISGYITLSGHDVLTSLMGLENINSDGITQLTITNNPNLSMCSASSICGHIEDNGMTTFSNNAGGCNSLTEVTDICTVSTHSPADALDIVISPNPSDGTFTIQGIINATYNILNLTGQIIQTGELKNETSIDISSEAQGVYFISISIDNQIFTKRIVKM